MHARLIALLHAGVAFDLRAWVFEPFVAIPLLVTAAWYARGAVLLARRSRTAVRARDVACFVGGWVTLVVALASPLHIASEQTFSAHMIQHELLMALAAPLLVLSRPVPVLLWALPPRGRQAVARVTRAHGVRTAWDLLTRPFDAWLIHGAAIWLWHIPSLFQASASSELVHAVQHVSFLGSAVLFWWSVIFGQRRAAHGLAVLYLFTTAVHTSVLGALMAFARQPWYTVYASGAAQWGLTPMSDQQLAGLIMWIPASAAYLVAALAVMRRWLADSAWSAAEREAIATARS